LFIHSTSVLQHVFHLTLLQVISVLICMDIFPNCAYFFDLAVYELVDRSVLYHGRPAAIGHHIAIRMLHHRDQYYAKKRPSKGKKMKLGVYRFNCYKQHPVLETLPSPTEWIECAVNKLVVCLFIWKRAPTKPPLRSLSEIYDCCSGLFQQTVHGMGPLAAKHQFAVLSSLGCIPSWLRTYTGMEGRVLEFFEERYPNLEWSGVAGRRTLTTIQTYLQNRYGDIWEISRIENLLCKIYRLISPTTADSTFVDVHRNDQILIVEVDSEYSVHFADGKVVNLPTNSLCTMWEMVGEPLLTPVDVATALGIETCYGSAQKFPSLDQLMETIDINQVEESFPSHQQKSSLLFGF
jgi:hypothetical protein